MSIRLRTASHPECWLADRSHSGIRCSRFQSDGRLFLTTGQSLALRVEKGSPHRTKPPERTRHAAQPELLLLKLGAVFAMMENVLENDNIEACILKR